MKKLLKLLLIGVGFLTLNAFAALDLELTQGVDTSIPMAIVPFTDPAISEVVSHDLQNSGRFRISDPNSFSQSPHNAANIDYNYWQNFKLNNVVVGNVTLGSAGKYNVTFQLLDVYNKSVLLDEKYAIAKSQFRNLAHHISDLIYQKLTGIRGVFSTKIAYVGRQHSTEDNTTKYSLMVADADGYGPKTMFATKEPIMSPAWSPDGKKIAYVSFEGKNAAIYVQEIANGSRKLLTKFPGINGAPAWSPDGSKLALVLTLSGYPKIYTFDLATSKTQALTSGWSLDTEPNWAPDGKSLVFTSDSGGSPQIYQYIFATGQVKRLTYKGNYNACAAFTADGKNIVMLNRDEGIFNIAIQNLDSGRVNVLANTGINKSPSVAPNGNMIVYATIEGGRGVLAEVSIDSRVKLLLPAQEGEVQDPAWSPFLN